MQMLQVQLEVGSDPKEVGRARRWARSRLAGFGLEPDESLVETLVLLVSELVTNAVVHTGRPAVLRMLLSGRLVTGGGTVRIEVADTSSSPPRRRRTEGDATGGRGLELVVGLADRWGWLQEGTGKRIWCELDRGSGAAAENTDARDTGDTGRAGARTAPHGAYDKPRAQPVRT
ncbi:ATP-binding protein [Streptomyces fenghuangensis]|uniref:ATP-binding protein n=1 Tax=Streptomyces chitinivorans TaxID=1257027 RepID=A0ABW7HYL4_9ACTN|nr:ATP-binding protein [Streptomyces chitinivorans]MDH2410287.1 ATP-binding protein [Streptomyces chitinivorans]